MIDTYICSADLGALVAFIKSYNYIAPRPGVAAVSFQAGIGGLPDIQARVAIGDPALSYSCIRTDAPVALPAGISQIDPALGAQIVGVWE